MGREGKMLFSKQKTENWKESALSLFFRKVYQVLGGLEKCFENVTIVPTNPSKVIMQKE